ncbi:MAG: outer membrane beta-barrel protein [Niabella sp.]
MYMQKAGLLSIFLIFSLLSRSQSVRGVIIDPVENVKVKGVTIVVKNVADTSKKEMGISDGKGAFNFPGLTLGNYILQASSVGFEYLQQPFSLTDSIPNLNLGEVYLPKKTETLEGVVVVYKPPTAAQKGDTTEYSASQYKVNPDATVEDLVKKMPGVTVDKSGTVTAQGEQVKKVTVDGKDFFGDDATIAMRNLPADVVDKIQVFDKLSEQAQLTGFDDGNSQRSINIVTKSGIKNGQFGRIFAGYGTNDRYQAGGNVSFFNGDRRISLVGNFNNVNQQNFAGQDLLGVSSGGGGGRGRGRGGRGGGSDFMVGQSPGISRTNAFGINYSDQWGDKLSVSGSYFFNNRKTTNESITNKITTISPDSLLTDNSWYNSEGNDYNHRVNLRFEYKLDSNNTIFFIPSLSFQNNESNSVYGSEGYYAPNDSTNTSNGRSESSRNGFNINNLLMYRHSFAKKGRTLFVALNNSYNKNDGYSITDEFTRTFYPTFIKDSTQNQKTINNTNSNQYGGRIGYTEPIGTKTMLEVSYNLSVQNNKANNESNQFDGTDYTIPFPQLSNVFDNKTTRNSAGLNYRIGQSRDNQLSFGVDFQNARLESNRILPTATTVDQTFNNVLPNLRWMRKLGRFSNMRIFYRANTDFPSVTQLQDVVNLSSQLTPSVGNPSLKQTFSNYISGRYTYTNTQNNKVLFVNLSARNTQNYISTATYLVRGADSTIENGVTILRNSQLSKPVNLNGYQSFYSMVTFSTPINTIKSNININAGANYERRPGLINYKNTITKNIVYNGGLGLVSNISEYVDFNLSYNVAFNNTISDANSSSNNRFVNQSIGAQINLLSKNGWFLQNDLSQQRYTGLTLSGTQNYWLWNVGAGKKFLKNNAGELKLSVFDLLNQNQSYARTIGDNYFQDSENLVLKQYFMLTFTYSLKNFGKGRASSGSEERGNWRRGEGGPPPGGGYGPPPGGGGPF